MFSADNIKQALKHGNEKGYKLFKEAADKNAIEKLKNEEHGKEMLKQIKSYAKAAGIEDSPKITFAMFKEFEKTGNRLIFEHAYFKRRQQLFSLVLDYIIEKDTSLLQPIEEKLWEWCDLYSWELPAHFSMKLKADSKNEATPDKTVALFSAESAFFFSEILSIIGKDLDELLVFRLKSEITRRVIEPYKSRNFWWEEAKMNWSSVCAGSVGAAAIYLIEDENELAEILERVIKSMGCFIEAFDKDGLITEGLSYWSYGFSFYVYFSELLRERTAGKISLLNTIEKIKKIAELPQKLQFPSGDFVNFSDSGSGKWNGDCGLFSRLENILSIKGYSYKDSFNIYNDHTYRWAAMARKLLWFSPSDNFNADTKEGTFYFEESQWLVDRRLAGKSFLAFAAKGGNNDEPHNHNDLGNFILHYNSENIFTDIGSPEYVKEYFRNETRYEFLAASSLGHSVPVINGQAQSYGKEYYAEVTDCREEDFKTCFKLNLTKAYDGGDLIRYERAFTFDYNNLELSIKDEFNFNKSSNEIKEIFITNIKPEIISNEKILICAEKSITELIYPEGLNALVEECEYNDHNGKKSSIFRIMLTGIVDECRTFDFNIKVTDRISKC